MQELCRAQCGDIAATSAGPATSLHHLYESHTPDIQPSVAVGCNTNLQPLTATCCCRPLVLRQLPSPSSCGLPHYCLKTLQTTLCIHCLLHIICLCRVNKHVHHPAPTLCCRSLLHKYQWVWLWLAEGGDSQAGHQTSKVGVCCEVERPPGGKTEGQCSSRPGSSRSSSGSSNMPNISELAEVFPTQKQSCFLFIVLYKHTMLTAPTCMPYTIAARPQAPTLEISTPLTVSWRGLPAVPTPSAAAAKPWAPWHAAAAMSLHLLTLQ
jgi:hypothetical protein